MDASVVKDVFRSNYSARVSENHTVTDNFGMWICIDKCDGTQTAHVGSGFATTANLIASYPLDVDDDAVDLPHVEDQVKPRSLSVSEILDNARTEISKVTGIPVEGISRDLHMKA